MGSQLLTRNQTTAPALEGGLNRWTKQPASQFTDRKRAQRARWGHSVLEQQVRGPRVASLASESLHSQP